MSDHSENSAASASGPTTGSNTPRRNFVFEGATAVIGLIVGVVPFAAGLVSFLDPLFRKNKTPGKHAKAGEGGKTEMVRICSLEALTTNGPPQRFPVITDQFDAWNFTPQQPIGSVYLQRISDSEVLVFNTTCPHAGCSVSCDGQAYHCPCHNSSFELNGSKRESESGRENPSPRSLDTLEHTIESGDVLVHYQNFYPGREEKKPKA
ncbi:MAG: (2Fe-2S)-binding protein [Planctomycetaceae bacterium]|nr:(2Fe-2S)-binding protein [Planctomycetaceae bacterium]